METKKKKRLPKILKINRIDKKRLCISVLFSNGEDRLLDFSRIFKEVWKITKKDFEYPLLDPNEFAKVKLANHTLSWNNIEIAIIGFNSNNKKTKVPYSIGADTLYPLSEIDKKLNISIGSMFRKARLAAHKSQEEVAKRSGTSRTYITRLENDKQDVEIRTFKKLVEAGLDKQLRISIC